MMKKLLSNSRGFSLLETVVVLGIMGASATYFMSMQNNIIKSQKRFEVQNDVNIMINDVNLVLISKEACRDSVATSDTNGQVQDNAILSQIVSSAASGSRPIISVGQRRPINTGPIGIVDIKIIEASTPVDDGLGQGTGDMNFKLEIAYNKLSTILEDLVPANQPDPEFTTFGRYRVYKTQTRTINAKVQMANNAIVECSTSEAIPGMENMFEEIRKIICVEDHGGEIDAVNGKCIIPEKTLELSEETNFEAGSKGSTVLGSTDEYDMCYVTGFRLETMKKGSNPDFGCEVYKSGGNWILNVPSSFRTRSESHCRAQCVKSCSKPIDGRWQATSQTECQKNNQDKKWYSYVQYTEIPAKCGGKPTPKPPSMVECVGYQECKLPKVKCQAAGNQCLTVQQCQQAGGTPNGGFNQK